MPDELDELHETQPIEEIPAEETISDAQTISDEEQPVSEEQPISDSQYISESQEMSQVQLGTPKPKSNIFSLLLIISTIFVILAIYMVAHELNHYYGVTFGGIISAPDKTTESTESGK
jgi:hypothetical protein